MLSLVSTFNDPEKFSVTLSELGGLKDKEQFSLAVFRVLALLSNKSEETFKVIYDNSIHERLIRIDGWKQAPYDAGYLPNSDDVFKASHFKKYMLRYLVGIKEFDFFNQRKPRLIPTLEEDLANLDDAQTLSLRLVRQVNGMPKLEDARDIEPKVSSLYYKMAAGFLKSMNIRDVEISKELLKAIYNEFPCNEYMGLIEFRELRKHPRLKSIDNLLSQADYIRKMRSNDSRLYVSAISCYKDILKFDNSHYRSFNGIGFCHIILASFSSEESDFLDAIKWFDRVLDDYDETLDYYYPLYKLKALCGKAICQLEISLLRNDECEAHSAIVFLREALEIETSNISIMLEIGYAYLQMLFLTSKENAFDMAVDSYKKVLEFDENDSYVFFQLGWCCASRATKTAEPSYFHEATKWLQKSYDLNPEKPSRLSQMGYYWSYMGQKTSQEALIKQALSWYFKAMELNPDQASKINYADCMQIVAKTDQDIDLFLQAIKIYESLNQTQKLKHLFLKVAKCKMEIGRITKMKSSYSRAIDSYKSVFKVFSLGNDGKCDLADCLQSRADILVKQEDYISAAIDYQEAIDFYKSIQSEQGVMYKIALCFSKMSQAKSELGLLHETLNWCEKSIQNDDESSDKSMFLIGEALLALGRDVGEASVFEGALSWLDKISPETRFAEDSKRPHLQKIKNLHRQCRMEIVWIQKRLVNQTRKQP